MDVKELVEAKQELEQEIAQFVQEKVAEFSRKSGVDVKWVSVYLLDMKEVGKRRSQHLVYEVKCDLDL